MIEIGLLITCLVIVPLGLTIAKVGKVRWLRSKLTWGAVAVCWALPCFVLAFLIPGQPWTAIGAHLAAVSALIYLKSRKLNISEAFILILWGLVIFELVVQPY